MAKELTKAEVRRNPLAEWVTAALQAVRERKRLAAGILAGILVIAAGTGVYVWYRAQQEREAQGLLVKAYSAMWSDGTSAQRNPDEAKKVYAEIAAKYTGTVAAEES